MSISNETREKIERFAGEQSIKYLEDAEMTYIEQLRRKGGMTKARVTKQLARLRARSSVGREAQSDMALYMTDHIGDLMSQGLSEQQAFDRACEQMRFASDSEQSTDLAERYRQYYERGGGVDYEAVGLFYGGFLFLGVAAGALIGYIISGGRAEFAAGGWIDTAIGAGVGAVFGIALGEIAHAVIALRGRRKI